MRPSVQFERIDGANTIVRAEFSRERLSRMNTGEVVACVDKVCRQGRIAEVREGANVAAWFVLGCLALLAVVAIVVGVL